MSTIYNVDPVTLNRWLENNEAVLIDVREAGEYQSKSISFARNLPLSYVTIDEAHLPEHRDKKLVIHCQTGRRSMMACEKLKGAGCPYDIWNLTGGITGWEQAGLPVQTQGRKVLPLDRQVQLVVGTLVLVGVAINIWLSPLGMVLPVIAGMGLINAGLTGKCPITHLMGDLPWNKNKK